VEEPAWTAADLLLGAGDDRAQAVVPGAVQAVGELDPVALSSVRLELETPTIR